MPGTSLIVIDGLWGNPELKAQTSVLRLFMRMTGKVLKNNNYFFTEP